MKKFLLPILFFALTVVSAMSSLYSQDTYNAWTLDLNNSARVYAISVCASNPRIVYCSGLDSGVYRSNDGGYSWTQVNTGLNYIKVQALAVAPSNPNIVYAGTDQNGSTNSGVYVTTNGGVSWTLMITGINDTKAIQDIAVSPTDPNTVYVTVFDGANAALVGVYKTTNGGTSWAAANTGMTNLNILSVAINPLNPNVVYAGSSLILPGSTGPSTMYRSNDAGATWTSVSNGLPTNTTTGDPIRSISISNLDTAVVLAGLFVNDTSGGAYLSTNGGQLWTKKFSGNPANVVGTLFRKVLIRPYTSNQFYVGLDGGTATSRGVWRSVDGGNNWVDFNSGAMVNTFTVRSLAFSVRCDTTLLCGGATSTPPGRGVYEYTFPFNQSACQMSWTTQVSGTTVQLNCVKAVSNLVVWTGGATAVVRKTTDAGLTWTNANPNTGVINGDIYAIDAIDANNAWVTTSPAATFIYRTTNGGTNWTQVFTQAGGFIDGLAYVDANNGFACGDPVGARWSLWRTTNGGANWDSTGMYVPQNGTEAGYNNAIVVKGNHIWFGTSGTRLYHSSNFGYTWAAQTTGAEANSYCLTFSDINLGMVGGATLLKTTDGGATFTVVTAPGTGIITGLSSVGNNFWFTRGTNVYASTNGGTSWTTAYTGAGNTLDIDVTTLACCPVGWAVGAGGLIAGVGFVTGTTGNNNQTPVHYTLSQNYPNPFNPSTKISFQLPSAGIVSLVVYDLLGREVKSLVNDFRQAGTYSVEFDASNYASGIYLYKLESGSFTETKKMLLVK